MAEFVNHHKTGTEDTYVTYDLINRACYIHLILMRKKCYDCPDALGMLVKLLDSRSKAACRTHCYCVMRGREQGSPYLPRQLQIRHQCDFYLKLRLRKYANYGVLLH